MFDILKLGDNYFDIITDRNTSWYRGTKQQVTSFLNITWQIQLDEIDLAFRDLLNPDYNLVEFGMWGSYTIPKKVNPVCST